MDNDSDDGKGSVQLAPHKVELVLSFPNKIITAPVTVNKQGDKANNKGGQEEAEEVNRGVSGHLGLEDHHVEPDEAHIHAGDPKAESEEIRQPN